MTATLQPDDALIDALIRTARQFGIDRQRGERGRAADPIEADERELMRAIVGAPAMRDWVRLMFVANLEAALRQAQQANAAVLADGGCDPHKWLDAIVSAQQAVAAALRQVSARPVNAIPPLRFMYRNHRGEIGARVVAPISIRHGSTAWHPEPQWLLRAYDLDKGAEREFAINDINPNEATR